MKEPEPFKSTRRYTDDDLRFTSYSWAKYLYMRDVGGTEVAFFGISSKTNLLLLEDIVMIKQKCTAATVEFDDEALADFQIQQSDLGREPYQFLRIWLHTHPGNSANPSGTDEETFARVFGRSDWAVMAILAKGGDEYVRLRFNVGPRIDVKLRMTIAYDAPCPALDHAAWLEEYKRTVNFQSYSSYTPTYYQGGHGVHGGRGGSRYTPGVYDDGDDENFFRGYLPGQPRSGSTSGMSNLPSVVRLPVAGRTVWVPDEPKFGAKAEAKDDAATDAVAVIGASSSAAEEYPETDEKATTELPSYLGRLDDLGASLTKADDSSAYTVEEATRALEQLKAGGAPFPDVETRAEILLDTKKRIDRISRTEFLVELSKCQQLSVSAELELKRLKREEMNADWLTANLPEAEQMQYGS